jgi:signal transduction histidine kinase
MLVYRTIFSLILACSITFSYALQEPRQNHSSHTDISSFEKLVIHYRYDNPDSAIYYADLGMKLAKKNNDEEGIARMLNQLGMIDDNRGKADASRQKYLEALEIYKRLDNKKGIVKENIRLGVVENRKGNYDKASSYFLAALKTSEKSKDNAGIMESYITLGEVYANQKRYQKALTYYNKAELISDQLPFSNLKLNLYSNFGAAYCGLKDYDAAIAYYEKGISQSNFSEMMGLNISMTIGLAQVYAAAGNVQKAIVLQKGALTKARKISNFIREYISLTALAESYQTTDRATSLYYLQQALHLVQSKNANKQVLDVLDKIAALQAENKNFKQAYLAKLHQYSIADSFYFKDISVRIANLQAEYELNKSQGKVDELRFINSEQELQKKIMLWIIAGGFTLILVLGVYYFKIRKLNLLLNGSNAALQESNDVKDKLFSILAHDLRSPLASVINLLEMINNGWLSEEEKDLMMSKLAAHCNASMETLNLLLQWGQMQLKGIMIKQIAIDPDKVLQRNVALLMEPAREKNILITQDVLTEEKAICDQDHLDFMLRNLLSNAIKFTRTGGNIKVSVKKYKEDQLLFAVEDDGVGIAADRLAAVFNLNNVSTNGTNNEKGTSLGLVICKEFITANDGEMWAESTEGAGSSFFFTLKTVKV